MGEASTAMAERLNAIEAEEFVGPITPAANPRDLLTFVRSLFVPADRLGDPPQLFQPHEAQRCLLEMLTEPRWRRFVIVACTQDGKTWCVMALLFWVTCELKEACIWGGPDMRIAQDAWLQKIRPTMESSGLAGFLPVAGDGSGGGSNVETIQLNGGGLVILLGAGGKNKSGQAGRTARWVIVDEFGKIKAELATKFDRRADAFDVDGRLVKAGTVEHSQADQLLAEYEESSKGRMHWRCHLCQDFTTLDWPQVDADWSSEVAAAETVRIRCARCGQPWTDAERRANLRTGVLLHAGQSIDRQGRITGTLPPTYTGGLRWSALDSPRRSLAKLAADYVLCLRKFDRGDAQPLEDFWHDQLAQVLRRAPGETDIDLDYLAARSTAGTYTVVHLEGREWRWAVPVLPAGVIFTTAAVDQSLRRLWWVIRGHDGDGRTWHLGWGRIAICGDLEEPSPDQRKAALDRLRADFARGLPTSTGRFQAPAVVGLDCAEFTDTSLDWLASAPGWIALHGTGDRQAGAMAANAGRATHERPGWYQLREYTRAARPYEVLWLYSDQVKSELARALRRPLDAPAAAHLPAGLDPHAQAADNLLAHLCAEKLLAAPGGKPTWVKAGRFSRFADLWDCSYYTQALARYVEDRWPERTIAAPPPGAVDEDRDVRRGEDFGSHLGAWA